VTRKVVTTRVAVMPAERKPEPGARTSAFRLTFAAPPPRVAWVHGPRPTRPPKDDAEPEPAA
jgi:hypothetical protein